MSPSLGKKSPLSVLTGAFVWKVGERWKPVGGFVGDEAEIICSPSPHPISSRPPRPSPALCSFPRQSAGFGLPTTPCLVALSYLEGQRAVQSERLFLGRYHLNHPRPAVVPGAFCLGTAPQESWGGPWFSEPCMLKLWPHHISYLGSPFYFQGVPQPTPVLKSTSAVGLPDGRRNIFRELIN